MLCVPVHDLNSNGLCDTRVFVLIFIPLSPPFARWLPRTLPFCTSAAAAPVQVDIPCAGNITIAPSSLFQCPTASNFVDDFNGLYGPDGAYPASSLYCSAAPFITQGIVYLAFTEVLVSTLQFQCQPCPLDTYSVFAGNSSGIPGGASNITCVPCPFGGVCLSGAVAATPGRWGGGGADGVLTFAPCPDGYCCDGGAWACDGPAACGYSRSGALCGDCMPGFVESIGTTACVPVSSCAGDRVFVWSGAVVALFAAAVLQLAVVSNVWLPSGMVSLPTAKLKLAIYYFQVRVACI